jgi:hypothetical protein
MNHHIDSEGKKAQERQEFVVASMVQLQTPALGNHPSLARER